MGVVPLSCAVVLAGRVSGVIARYRIVLTFASTLLQESTRRSSAGDRERGVVAASLDCSWNPPDRSPRPLWPSWWCTSPGRGSTKCSRRLATQDYSNLKNLFLVVGEPGDLPARIRDRVPNAFVRAVENNPGFGAAANEVLRLVEGDNGFFCFLHDDVALEQGAIRLLVEELYRSNAGVVGPKLVTWDDPTVLQHVGLGVDRFGEVDPIVEPGEVDQEQHDAVRDTFAVAVGLLAGARRPVSCDRRLRPDDRVLRRRRRPVLARPTSAALGSIVVPAARARHREQLARSVARTCAMPR